MLGDFFFTIYYLRHILIPTIIITLIVTYLFDRYNHKVIKLLEWLNDHLT